MDTTNLTRAGLALLFAATLACGGPAEPETPPAPPTTTVVATPPVADPPPAPTAETIPVPADYQQEVAAAITPENVEAQLAALEAEDATDPPAVPAH